ncbi:MULTISPECIES: TIGR04222 domain-containing membrane protein [Streptosporangium]|uniref:TIGR04222 domain-containing membrane protein n=1 Tax=Streptosporangium brasiliense TaxID=47480 RepID=A0ABT9R747_9ACTN|nr:TIGR04222 domain-containing membrane protein [Streptosporangium brasiliense]MDP9865066.1 hypothetical protein [Streptosporangium brasiliense]
MLTTLIVVVTVALVTVAGLIALRLAMHSPKVYRGPAPDLYELSQLAGGRFRVANTALAALAARGALTARRDGRLIRVAPPPQGIADPEGTSGPEGVPPTAGTPPPGRISGPGRISDLEAASPPEGASAPKRVSGPAGIPPPAETSSPGRVSGPEGTSGLEGTAAPEGTSDLEAASAPRRVSGPAGIPPPAETSSPGRISDPEGTSGLAGASHPVEAEILALLGDRPGGLPVWEVKAAIVRGPAVTALIAHMEGLGLVEACGAARVEPTRLGQAALVHHRLRHREEASLPPRPRDHVSRAEFDLCGIALYGLGRASDRELAAVLSLSGTPAPPAPGGDRGPDAPRGRGGDDR